MVYGQVTRLLKATNVTQVQFLDHSLIGSGPSTYVEYPRMAKEWKHLELLKQTRQRKSIHFIPSVIWKKRAVKTWLLSSSNGKSTPKKNMERHVMISDSKNLTVDLVFWRSTDSNQRASFTHLENPGVWDHTRGPLKHLSSRWEAAANGFCSKAMRPLPFWTSDFWSSKFGTSSIFFYK